MITRISRDIQAAFKKYHEYILLFSCLTVFLFLYFSQLFNLQSGLRTTFDFDFYHYHLPYNWYVQTLLAKGWLPLWDPLSENGYPLIGESTLQFFYPPNLLRIFFFQPSTIFHTILSLEIMHLLHFYVLGFGMFLLLRKRYAYSFFASLFASVAITFNGIILFLTTHGHITTVELFAWFPWLLLTLGAVIETGRKMYIVAAICVVYLILNAGYLPLAEVSFLLAIIYLFFNYFIPFRKAMIRSVFDILLIFILGIGLSGIMLIPQAELALHTARVHENSTTTGYQDVQIYSNTPADIIKDFIYPVSMNTGYFAYVGLATTILFLLFFLLDRISRVEKGIASLALGIAFITLGGFLGPLFVPLYYWPTLGLLRVPSRLMFFADFFVIVIAAASLSRIELSEAIARRINSIVSKIAFIPVGTIAIISLLLLLIFSADTTRVFGDLETSLETLSEQTLFLCIMALLSGGAIWQFTRAEGKGVVTKLFLICILFIDLTIATTKTVTFASLADAQVYGLNNLTLIQMKQMAFASGVRGEYYYKNWFNDEELYELKPSVKGSTPSHLYSAVTLDTYAVNPNIQLIRGQKTFTLGEQTYSRWWIVTNCIFVSNNEEAMSLLTNGRVDPRTQVVLLDTDKNEVVNNCNNRANQFQLHEQVSQNNFLRFSYDSKSNGILYLSEMYYPGWQARVDGRSVPILRANYTFRGVPIPKGKHIVSFSYKPFSLLIGLLVSVVSLLITILALLFYFKKKKSQKKYETK